MKRSAIIRQFNYNGMTLADPNPDAPVGVVLKALSAAYPELAGGKVEPAEVTQTTGGELHTFAIKVGYGERG